ncbi:hypothetical protein A1O7_04019 [Cladophialophora yegresii CBS 114405]|uniref:Uncharacterized protein n=1 Tax=Cladophialophora yegresii CBS 114405 TaxID=1182544 RepID=W9VVR5_9EURO|nr:uncharacterized protein A1O7_04019 [Cladophialophora yegresii CBS 114405]EXJ59872.1 hypothetical protein A1O7_04019 [Cladophialophora yegresii CBS 114405]
MAGVYGFARLKDETKGSLGKIQGYEFCRSRRGCLVAGYYRPHRKQQFAATIMDTKGVISKEGWLACGSEQDGIRHNVNDQSGNSAIGCLDFLIDATDH